MYKQNYNIEVPKLANIMKFQKIYLYMQCKNLFIIYRNYKRFILFFNPQYHENIFCAKSTSFNSFLFAYKTLQKED